jgi:DNA adenine methylase
MTPKVLRAPFPWYGGKSLAAPAIWQALGDVPNYVEPFAGSLATLLARPHAAHVETINDRDGFVANFWRAVAAAPATVAGHCDHPVNEADLHARHRWRGGQAPLLERLIEDPDFFDAKIAGWWCWGVCTWIGNGWCSPGSAMGRRRPSLGNAHGYGVATHRSLPKVGTPGHGVHSLSRKKPTTHTSKGVHRGAIDMIQVFAALSDRLRNVRVCCGDWTRITGRSTLGIDTAHGMTPCGIVLDPPYSVHLRKRGLYRVDNPGVAEDVRAWAIANGDNPQLRIVLCVLEGEHEMPATWRCIPGASRGASSARERLWLSPHCLNQTQGQLFR